MTIIFDKYLLAVWFVEIPNGDWMAGLTECQDGSFMLTYRFRHYNKGPAPLGVWDGSDTKRWYTAKFTAKEPLMEAARDLARLAKAVTRSGKSYEFLRGDKTTKRFLEELLKAPFAHTKKVSKAEYEQYQRDGRLPP